MSSPYRILIVDDDPVFVKATTAVLESQWYVVDSASGGEAGLTKMKEDKPDLVILDVMMDWVLDGVEVSREMMRQPRLQGVPIIMASSIRSSEYKGTFPQDEYLHMNSWIDKPCSPDQLLAQVQATMARHEKYKGFS